MFAAFASLVDPEDPLPRLELGERPEPQVPDGWTTVRVRATSLNHHDLWTLRGVGISPDRLPIVLGCDAAGIDEDGNEVVVHSVVGDPDAGAATRRWTRAAPCCRSGTTARSRTGGGARRNLVPKPAALSLRGGRLPAHRLADRLPDAVRQVRGGAGVDGTGPGGRAAGWRPR